MEELSKVSLVSCKSYKQEEVDKAVKEAVDLIGGLKTFVKKGQTVVLKPNLVAKMHPDKAGTTHPNVVVAIAKEIIKLGAKCIIADSPGGTYTKGFMNGIYKATGMFTAVEQSGAIVNEDFGYEIVDFKEGIIGKKVEIISVLLKADVIINVCKMKTHTFTGYTGAVKNLFGAIPGLVKVQMHGQFKTLDPFCNFNIDTIEYLKPKLSLHICDAIVAMEGPGPTSGTPIQVNKILASIDAYALDTIMVKMMNVKPEFMPTLNVAVKRGLLNKNYKVEVLGENLEDSIIKSYKTMIAQDHRPLDKFVPTFLQKKLGNFITRRPKVKIKACKGCGKCMKHCPVGAITMVKKFGIKNKVAVIDYNKCIRCYCCQELCPYHVISVKTPLGYKLIRGRDFKKQRINNKKVAKDIIQSNK